MDNNRCFWGLAGIYTYRFIPRNNQSDRKVFPGWYCTRCVLHNFLLSNLTCLFLWSLLRKYMGDSPQWLPYWFVGPLNFYFMSELDMWHRTFEVLWDEKHQIFTFVGMRVAMFSLLVSQVFWGQMGYIWGMSPKKWDVSGYDWSTVVD